MDMRIRPLAKLWQVYESEVPHAYSVFKKVTGHIVDVKGPKVVVKWDKSCRTITYHRDFLLASKNIGPGSGPVLETNGSKLSDNTL